MADARAALREAESDDAGARLVTLARAYDRMNLLDSAASAYNRAAARLPRVADWLLLRAAGVLADSAARAGLYQHVSLPAAAARISWTEALARERTGAVECRTELRRAGCELSAADRLAQTGFSGAQRDPARPARVMGPRALPTTRGMRSESGSSFAQLRPRGSDGGARPPRPLPTRAGRRVYAGWPLSTPIIHLPSRPGFPPNEDDRVQAIKSQELRTRLIPARPQPARTAPAVPIAALGEWRGEHQGRAPTRQQDSRADMLGIRETSRGAHRYLEVARRPSTARAPAGAGGGHHALSRRGSRADVAQPLPIARVPSERPRRANGRASPGRGRDPTRQERDGARCWTVPRHYALPANPLGLERHRRGAAGRPPRLEEPSARWNAPAHAGAVGSSRGAIRIPRVARDAEAARHDCRHRRRAAGMTTSRPSGGGRMTDRRSPVAFPIPGVPICSTKRAAGVDH